jgi:sarcosine oxidase/L-pipecolate oxidase
LDTADKQLDASSKAYANDVALGMRTAKYDSVDTVLRTLFPDGVKTGRAFEPDSEGDASARTAAYFNRDSGWVAATRGVELLMARVIALGGRVMSGRAVTGLVRREDGQTCGVSLADGSTIHAGLVVVASGSWTASTFRELALDEKCVSIG